MIQLPKFLEHVIKMEQDILIHKTIPKKYKPISLETDFTSLATLFKCRIGKNILLTSDKS